MNVRMLNPEMKAVYDGFSDTFLRSLLRFQHDAHPKTPTVNAHTLIRDLSRGSLNGENREALEEAARRDGIAFDPLRPYVSFRDLTVASAPGGGYLKGTDMQDVVDILRPWSVMARAGIQIELGLVGDQVVPRVSANTTPAWLPTEGTQITPSTPTLIQIPLTPHQVGAVLQYSRQFSKQANAPRFAAMELLRTVGTAMDQAVLNGSGAAGQPSGLLQQSIQTMSGTTLTGASANEMKQLSAEANAPDEGISFLGTPTVRLILENRERAAGSGFVWDNDRIASRPGAVSTDVPTDTLLCGPWSLIYLGIWGQGLTLEINPFDQTGFKSGMIQARVIVACDVAVLHPSAFVSATGVS
jgi:HK97 family phage major capsid protein